MIPGIDSKENPHQHSGLNDDANNIQDKKDVQIEVSATTEI